MWKGWLICILAALMLPVAANAASYPRDALKGLPTVKSVSNQAFFSNEEGEQAAAILIHQEVVANGSTGNNYHSRLGGYAGYIDAAANVSTMGFAFIGNENGYLQHKKYLVYIYPSHNFW